MRDVQVIDIEVGFKLAEMQQLFYDKNASFVICCLQDNVESFLDTNELLEVMNVTPSESEA